MLPTPRTESTVIMAFWECMDGDGLSPPERYSVTRVAFVAVDFITVRPAVMGGVNHPIL